MRAGTAGVVGKTEARGRAALAPAGSRRREPRIVGSGFVGGSRLASAYMSGRTARTLSSVAGVLGWKRVSFSSLRSKKIVMSVPNHWPADSYRGNKKGKEGKKGNTSGGAASPKESLGQRGAAG